MGRQRILAVDDEEHILELIQYNLEMNQYDVLLAESGEKALEILKSNEENHIVCIPNVFGEMEWATDKAKEYFDEAGTDISGMSDEDILEASEVFELPSGRFLIVEG